MPMLPKNIADFSKIGYVLLLNINDTFNVWTSIYTAWDVKN